MAIRGDNKMRYSLKHYILILGCLLICFSFHFKSVQANQGNIIDIVNPHDGEGWQVDFQQNITITKDGTYLIEGHHTKTEHTLTIEKNLNVSLVFSGVYIEGPALEQYHAVSIKEGARATIDFLDDTTLVGTGKLSSGIYVGNGTNLKILNSSGKGTLKLKGGDSGGYGIGSHETMYYGTIQILGGHIIAEAGKGTVRQQQGLEAFDAPPSVAIGAASVDVSQQTLIKIAGSANVTAYGSYAGAAIGFAGECIDYGSYPPLDYDDLSTWTKDTFRTDTVNMEIGGEAIVLAYGGTGSPGIGANIYCGIIKIKDNAKVTAYGGDGKRVDTAHLISDSVMPGGAGIGSGGMAGQFNGPIYIEDHAIVKTYGGKGIIEYSQLSNNITLSGPGIGWGGVGTMYGYPASGSDDLTWRYIAPIEIHGYGIYAKGGEAITDQGLTTGTGAAIGRCGSYYNEDGTLNVVQPIDRLSGSDGKMRPEIKKMTYHRNSISAQNCILYTSSNFILPPTSYIANYDASFPYQRYSEWSDDPNATQGLAEESEYTGSATDLYMVQNPILYKNSLTEKSQDIPLQGEIVLKFNKKMNVSEFGTISLKNKTNGSHIQIKEGLWSEEDMTLTITYDSLTPSSTYILEVEGFKDTNQIVMRKADMTFTTIKLAPIKANPENNIHKIEGNENYIAGQNIRIYVMGDRQNEVPITIGDERYLPLEATIEELNLKEDFDETYTVEFPIEKAGEYTVKIRYQLQSWDGSEWKNVLNGITSQSIHISVSEKIEKDDDNKVDNTDKIDSSNSSQNTNDKVDIVNNDVKNTNQVNHKKETDRVSTVDNQDPKTMIVVMLISILGVLIIGRKIKINDKCKRVVK